VIAEQFLASSSKHSPLRIGILLDDLALPRCFVQVIDHIQRSNFASIELLMLHAPESRPETLLPKSRLARLWKILLDAKRRKHLGYALYQKFDRKNFGDKNDPEEMIDCNGRLSGIQRLEITPITKGFVHRFTPEDVEKIRKADLDVILRFGFNILRGDILTASRYGVWSYHHGDNEFYRGGPAHFWELYEGNKLSGVILQVLTEELDAGQVLAKAQFSTVEDGISVKQNRFTPYWGAAHFVIQKLFELHNYGWEHLQRNRVPDAPYKGKRKLYRTPTNWELCGWLLPKLAAKGARRVARAFTGQTVWLWRIAMSTGDQQLFDSQNHNGHAAFRWLIPPRGHFHADPFLVEEQGHTWMFFEDYLFCEEKAGIVCQELLSGGRLGEARTVLQRPYHLSYPFVFEYAGNHYLIPESASNDTVELYRASEFPYRWSLQKVLFRGKAVDTTVFIDGETFWFFTTLLPPAGDGLCFCIFYSDRVDGDWHWHSANPISMDVRDARSGGRIFRQGGKLIRVSQDCSGRYGSTFSFREIVTLTKTEYRETLLQTVEPWSEAFCGTHTYDRCRGVQVIDGMTYAPRSLNMVSAELPAEPVSQSNDD